MNLYHTPMMPGPFDDTAQARQKRMGLIDDSGRPDQVALAAMARVYAGLMFDDLCESSPDMERVYAVCERFKSLAGAGETRKTMIFICLQYDGMLRPLPDPIWWIAGSDALLVPFVETFVHCIAEYAQYPDDSGK